MPRSKSGSRKKRAVLYTRVSTEEQARQGYSLRDQEDRLRKYCKLKGIDVVTHFQDDASAKTFDRPAFNDLLEYVREHRREIDLVLFVKWDRFSRNAEAAYRMIRQLNDHGIDVEAVDQPIDLSVPENKLMLAFHLAAPEVENERRSLNTKRGMRQAMREGRWVSRPPKGYSREMRAGDKSILVPDDDARFVREAFEEMAKGVYAMEEVRRRLVKKGFDVSNSQFGPMLRNVLYMGKIHIEAWQDEEAETVQGVHEPIVSEALFNKVQKVLDTLEGNRKGKPSTRKEELPLRGYLKCKRCGGNLTGSGTTGNGGKYWYYHCQHGCKERFRADEANEMFVGHLDDISVAPEIAELYLAVMEDIFQEKEGDREEQIADVDTSIEDLEEKLLEVDERYVEGDLERDSYRRLKDAYSERLEEKRSRKRELERTDTNFMKYARYGLSLVSDLPKYYQTASLEVKQKLIGLIYPDKLVYDEGDYRTDEVNEVITLLSGKKADLRVKTERPTATNGSRSGKAALPGFEPGTSASRAQRSAD